MINMAEEIESVEETSVEEVPAETLDVNYACLRCGTLVSNTELSRLPEIKCICGFRVFTKVRPPVVKTVKAI
jgi:DNA-directed RNA polymerase subunit P